MGVMKLIRQVEYDVVRSKCEALKATNKELSGKLDQALQQLANQRIKNEQLHAKNVELERQADQDAKTIGDLKNQIGPDPLLDAGSV